MLMNRVMLFLVLSMIPSSLFADDWSAIRGDDGTGSIAPGGVLASGKAVELKVAWKKTIGSGYSSVVVNDDKVIALYSESEHDVIACLNAANGETIWKTQIGPRFIGKNGSFDGPVSTPVIHADRVFALSPVGRLFCFKMADGSEVWSRDLQEKDNAALPLYGFTTSAIVFDDSLIVQIGAPEKAVACFECSSGEIKWTAIDDSISSQSPAIIELGGQSVLLASGGKKLSGLDPTNGHTFFEYEHAGGNGSAVMPVAFDDNKLILTVDDGYSKAVSLQPAGEKINVSEEWQERSIKNTYNIPVIHDGNAFAYSTRILTCVDTTTGKAHWKSRSPGDGFLIVVDGHMVINTKQGGLHIVKASAEKYNEVAKLNLFDDLVWSLPAYSDNSVYLRSLGEIARVNIVATDENAVSTAHDELPMGPGFREFIQELDQSESAVQRNGLIDQFLSRQTEFPIVENDVVHFVYRGLAQDVALASDIFGARQERKMLHVDETDLFYYTLQLPDDQRANYVFLVDYELQLDPSNLKRVATSSVYAGEMEFAVRLPDAEPLEMNWFAMEDWIEPPYLIVIGDDESKFDVVEIPGEGDKPKASCRVLLPPNYEPNSEISYPVVYVLSGTQANKFGDFARMATKIFENQGQSGYEDVPPSIVVFTDNSGPDIIEKILPAIDSKYKTNASRDGRSIVSNGFAGAQGLLLALGNTDKFSAVSTQSPLLFARAAESVKQSLDKLDAPVSIYLDWGRYDMFNPHENWDIRKSSKEFFDLFSANEHITLFGGEVNDSTDWSSWRNRYARVLQILTKRE